jgi:hypothetical protein
VQKNFTKQEWVLKECILIFLIVAAVLCSYFSLAGYILMAGTVQLFRRYWVFVST